MCQIFMKIQCFSQFTDLIEKQAVSNSYFHKNNSEWMYLTPQGHIQIAGSFKRHVDFNDKTILRLD